MVVEICGAVIWRALLLKTPSDLETPASVPPVTLLCCVYLKSARLVPAAAMVTATMDSTFLYRMTYLRYRDELHPAAFEPRPKRVSNRELLRGELRTEVSRIQVKSDPRASFSSCCL